METETKNSLRNDIREVMKGVAIEVIAAAIIALAALTITAIVVAAGSKSK